MQKNFFRKMPVLSILVLFLGVSISPTINGDIVNNKNLINSIEENNYFDNLLTYDPPEVNWEKTYGGSSYDGGMSIQQTNDNGYIITGYTNSIGNGGYDVWLIKTDVNGDEEWNHTFGGQYSDTGNDVQQTTDGGYIIVGNTESYGIGSSIWLIKTDEFGNEEWNNTFSYGYEDNQGLSVDQTTDGGYIITGYGLFIVPSDHYNLVLIKTFFDGTEEWRQEFGDFTSWEQGYDVQQTQDDGYIITGYTSQYGGSDIWLIKTDKYGEEDWNKTFGIAEGGFGFSVQETKDNGFIITGGVIDSVYYSIDLLLIKTNSFGEEEWNNTFGGKEDDWGYHVNQTNDNGYIVTGSTESFGHGGSDMWVIKTDEDGSESWTLRLGGQQNEIGYSIQQTIDLGYIITGSIESYGHGGSDVWLIKLQTDEENLPPNPPTITGPTTGNSGIEYNYSFSTTDPDGDDVYYWISWGDDTHNGWQGPYPSGQNITVSHSWDNPGFYEVEAKAKDTYGAQSNWNKTLVEITVGVILKIDEISGGFFRVRTVIRNTGTVAASNVRYHIHVEKSLITDTSKIIPSIPAGGEVSVQSQPILGLGLTTVTVNADMAGISAKPRVQDGVILLFFIYVKPDNSNSI